MKKKFEYLVVESKDGKNYILRDVQGKVQRDNIEFYP